MEEAKYLKEGYERFLEKLRSYYNSCPKCGFWVACPECSRRYSAIDKELRIKEGKSVEDIV